MKITLNYNTVYAFATQRNATQRNATQRNATQPYYHTNYLKLFFPKNLNYASVIISIYLSDISIFLILIKIQ